MTVQVCKPYLGTVSS